MALGIMVEEIEQEVERETRLPTPRELKNKIQINSEAEKTVLESRKYIANILDGKDKRLLIITGPCSIDNIDAAKEYAKKLKKLSEEIKEDGFLVMRTYFEKPRTTIGWKGMIYDHEGYEKIRKLLIKINEIGIPCATEFLGEFAPEYYRDLISYAAIGARTAESQIHREMASDLEMPVGIKNGEKGDVDIAINGVLSANHKHERDKISQNGYPIRIITKGNKYAHVILRGGKEPNYDQTSIQKVLESLEKKDLKKSLVIDCSHGNSGKDYLKQPIVFKDVLEQRKNKNEFLVGIMLESYLIDGAGDKYGQSKTDKCMGWEMTEEVIRECRGLKD